MIIKIMFTIAASLATTQSAFALCHYEAVQGHIVLVCDDPTYPPKPEAPQNCHYVRVCESLGMDCHNELICPPR